MILKRSSLFYHFLNTYSGWKGEWEPLDLCSLMRKTIIGLIAVGGLILGLSVVAGAFIAAPLFGLLVGLQFGIWQIELFIPIGAAALVGSLLGLCWLIRGKANLIPEPVREAYHSWKNNYCLKIEVK